VTQRHHWRYGCDACCSCQELRVYSYIIIYCMYVNIYICIYKYACRIIICIYCILDLNTYFCILHLNDSGSTLSGNHSLKISKK
jgi:hypothetical protein